MISIGKIIAVAIISIGLIGNARADRPPSQPGVIYVVAGIGGWDVLSKSAGCAFAKAGVQHEVREFKWSHGFGKWHEDLRDSVHVEQKALELAKEIRRYRKKHPSRPIYVMARSGGAGLALRAIELLPPETVDRIVLLSAAVSRTYDLRPALKATRREIVSYSSRFDQFILNWGTRKFGTIDRVHGPSAGLNGFVVAEYVATEDESVYDRLIQIPWTPRMILRGHAGGHTGTSLPRFLRTEVARWVR